MPDSIIVVAEPSKEKKTSRKGLYIVLSILIVAIIFFGIMIYSHKKEMDNIKSLIKIEASNYTDPDKSTQLITDMCGEILSNRSWRRVAKKMSSDMSISYEQVVVDLAMAQLRYLKYLA